jgi:hypothetical protein
MGKQQEVGYKGIKLTIMQESSGQYSVYFSNLPGNFEPLGNIKALRDQPSLEEGIEVGKRFVDAHQWERVGSVGVFDVWVRHWWDGDWGYKVGSKNDGNFCYRAIAVEAGMEFARKEVERITAEVEVSKKR